MKGQNFEEFIKKKFEDFEIEPSEGLMSKIFETRQKRNIKKGGSWNMKSLYFLLLGVILSGSWIFITTNGAKTKQVAGTVEQFSDPVLEDNELVDERENYNFENIEKTQKLANTDQDNKNVSEKEIQQKNNANNFIVKNENYKSKQKNEISTKETKVKEEGLLNQNTKEVSTTFENPESDLVIDKHSNKHIQNNIVNSTREKVLYFQLPRHSIQKTFYSTLIQNKSSLTSSNLLFTPITYKRPRKFNTESFWIKEVEINAGLGFWNRESSAYPIGFEESSLFSLDVNARSRVKLSDKFNFITGVSYNSMHSKVNFSRMKSEKIRVIDTTYGVIINPGAPPTPITKYDTSFNTIINYYKGKSSNKYSRFSLPLGLEYQQKFGKHVFYANGGLLITLYTFDKGAWLNESDFEFLRFKGRTKQTSTSFNSGIFTGLGYGYVLSSEWVWVIETNVSAWNFANNPLGVQKNNLVINTALNTGLRWKF